MLQAIAPSPTVDHERCAVGAAGLDGCRICVERCPYEAIVVRETPDGARIAIDPHLCQRCGACSGSCPTSAVRRPFLEDAELLRLLVNAAGSGGPLIVTCPASADLLHTDAPVVEVPSLLIVNETHLLAAIAAGADAVLLLGCLSCHHGRPTALLEPLSVVRVVLDDPRRVTYVEDEPGGLASALAAAAVLPALTQGPAADRLGDLRAAVTRRERLAVLLRDLPPAAPAVLAAAGFGQVVLDEDACVACGACAAVCPTGALEFDGGGTTLSVVDLDCVACGACVAGCPDDAITVLPVLPTGPAAMTRRILLDDPSADCLRCGTAYAPQRLLDHAREVLAASGLDPDDPRFQLGVCPECRQTGTRTRPIAKHQAPGPDGCGCGPGCGAGACAGAGAGDQPDHTGCACASPTFDHPDGAFLGEVIGAPGGPVGLPLTGRRSFLKGLGTAAIVGASMPLWGSLPAAAQERPVIVPGRLGMVIDLARCIGCHACTASCKAENHVPLGVFRDWVEEHTLGEYPHARPVFLPKLCNHCDDPGCLRACPTGAIFKREDGIVDLDHDICIACRACNQACPYGATFMDPVRGTADKCNLCVHRVDDGLNPACVDICPSQCRIFGDFDDPDSAVSVALRDRPSDVLRPELGLGPNVRYLGLPGELNR